MSSTGCERIHEAFARARVEGRAALIPYLMAGDPGVEQSIAIALAVVGAGADVLELGMPFSDPLADGPTIQAAAERSLRAGTTLASCLDVVRGIRRESQVPLVLMGYTNPVMRYGVERFCRDLAAAGGDGLIVADMPPEEADELRASADAHGIGLTFLVAPTSDTQRIKQVAALTTGFLYCVSLTGVTGARTELPRALPAFLEGARAVTSLPVSVGFGVATPEQVQELAPLADGVVVGSALVARIAAAGKHAPRDAAAFVGELRAATLVRVPAG